jgi:hypothetical protein
MNFRNYSATLSESGFTRFKDLQDAVIKNILLILKSYKS